MYKNYNLADYGQNLVVCLQQENLNSAEQQFFFTIIEPGPITFGINFIARGYTVTIEIKPETIEDVIKELRSGAWQVPKFQREFVWSQSQIFELINSIFSSRPIGMITLWAQPDENELPLEPISIPDVKGKPKYFSEVGVHPKKYYAILDGRQRCTALAMVFGGLSPEYGLKKFAGKYFLDASSTEEVSQVIFKKKSEIEKENLNAPSACYAKGLFPLFPTEEGSGIQGQFLKYFMEINDPKNYSGNELPEESELKRRQTVLKNAYEGLMNTKLAVTIVPESYSLDQICDIFETLNQTGTKVSTVDLIHAKLYHETKRDFDLRDWIDSLSEMNGTNGWANKDRRPELIAQFVTACYLALPKGEKEAPKKVAGKSVEISSVKSRDLLATPASHWSNVKLNEETFASYFVEMQKCIIDGNFSMRHCPYPISTAIYVALRWYFKFSRESKSWGIDQLNCLFRAFFWKNALSERYAQGFLSQMGSDLIFLRGLLSEYEDYDSFAIWAKYANERLNGFMKIEPITEEGLLKKLTDVQRGALNAAFRLPLNIRVKKDLLNVGIIEDGMKEFHHIYPKKWCKSNMDGKLAKILSTDPSDQNYVYSVVNLTLLSKESNLAWRDKVPGQALIEKNIDYSIQERVFNSAFIDREGFNILIKSPPNPEKFWARRATKMAKFFAELASVKA